MDVVVKTVNQELTTWGRGITKKIAGLRIPAKACTTKSPEKQIVAERSQPMKLTQPMDCCRA